MHESDLVELKYISEAEANMNLWGLTSIIDASTTWNKMHSVSGILFFDKGYFGQILEGTRSAVEETWGRIKNDSRHSNIELLGITEIAERRFPNWSMKLFNAEEFSVAFPQYSELLAKVNDSDLKTLESMRLLWRGI